MNTPRLSSILALGVLLSACGTSGLPENPQRFEVLGTLDLTVGESTRVSPQDLTVTGIQLRAVRSSTVDSGGYRYISTTYQVRNASLAGEPSPTSKTNVTFVAVDTQNTLLNTAVRTLKKADGTVANPALALQVLPSGHLAPDGSVSGTQSFQAFTFSETSTLNGLPTSIENVLPYGYVVDRTGGGRTLDANPATGDYQGTVTVSVKVPLQTPIENTPTSVTLSMIYVEDSVTQVTESLEEQPDPTLLNSRASTAGAERINVLAGSTFTGSYTRTLCYVPTAGDGSSTLVHQAPIVGGRMACCAVDLPRSSLLQGQDLA
ncbi:hypothetical protein [Deinococcus cellulosilyticus]|uniref:Lipoprotein n=1 Tax=Deinococcus cellulosilyticus (strain DSM 18568 / NBRC 106333 / KACC 11606 / 5516J-15) TaxID=1223518 RepID=A0A511MYC3_DEIC1|nr:hypothetical protein [Deinococcus cellulosilyticus]GEM45585.1 hypothetical protein DC3_12200 [Deinococcus cellulosilyticus NBRC 106333 = KACC 11606]